MEPYQLTTVPPGDPVQPSMSDNQNNDGSADETTDGQSIQDQRQGQSTDGQSTGGQSTGGQSTGQTIGGQGQPGSQSTGGQSTGGQSTGGQGQPGGQQTGGQGQPTGGQSGQTGRHERQGSVSTGGTGLEPNVAAALAYLVIPLTSVAMLVMEDDEFVQFHSKQAIGYGAVVLVAWIGLSILSFVLGFIFDPLTLLVLPLNLLLFLGGFAGWAFLLYKSYSGEMFRLPVIGNIIA